MRLRVPILVWLAFLFTCEVGAGTHMGQTVRQKRMHGTGGYKKAAGDVQGRGLTERERKLASSLDQQIKASQRIGTNQVSAVDVDHSPDADAIRARCKADIVFLYDEFVAGFETLRGKERVKRKLGAFHMFLIDFLLLDLPGGMPGEKYIGGVAAIFAVERLHAGSRRERGLSGDVVVLENAGWRAGDSEWAGR